MSRPPSRVCLGCGRRFTPAQPHHNRCWTCYRADPIPTREFLQPIAPQPPSAPVYPCAVKALPPPVRPTPVEELERLYHHVEASDRRSVRPGSDPHGNPSTFPSTFTDAS